jgi:hypothetical protein
MGADLIQTAAEINADPKGKGPTLWVTPGRIFTEIEALDILSGARAVQAGSGGIAGAEGAVWLAVFGTAAQVAKAEEIIGSVRGEPPFVEI